MKSKFPKVYIFCILTLLAVREGMIACRLECFSFCKKKSTALTVVKAYATIQYSIAQRGFDCTRLRINIWTKENCLTLKNFNAARINAGGTAHPRRKLSARAAQAKPPSLCY
jgi:hypothetical protein